MIRSKAGKAITLAAATLAAGALAVNCSRGHKTEETGRVSLALTIPGGVTINSVSYQVLSSTSAVLLSGSFDVSDPNAAPSFDFVLPPSTGDRVTLSATSVSTPVRTFTGTSLPFNIVSAQTTMVSVTLTDTVAGTPPGTVLVNGTIVPGNNPPVITSVVVAPSQTSTGANIAVTVSATDADGDALSYAWTASAPGGSFASASSATTTFSSTTPGPQTVTITVTDNHAPTPASSSVTLPVTIIGTGAGGTGGTGGAGGTGGTAGAGGMSGAGGAGGMMMVGENTCPAAEPRSGGACGGCTTGNCSLGGSGTDGCCGLAAVGDQDLCAAVVACFTTNSPTCTSSGDGTNCFCGSSGGACFMTAGAANGPCTVEVIAAAKTSSPPAIQGQFTSPASPLGRAVNLIACRGSFCTGECMIQ